MASKSNLPVPLGPVGSAIVEAIPACLVTICDGWRTRSNIRTAVQAIETSHALRMENCDYLEAVLARYGEIMSQDVRDAYLLRILELTDGRYYVMPWDRLLPGRR